MKRSIGPFSLLLASVSAIIGSGWLFAAYYSAKLAGPAAIISWIIAGVLIIGVALVFAELCSMLPVSGSSTRIPLFTHGILVSFIFSWMVWLVYMAYTPAEVQAVLQYARFYFPSLTTSNGALTSRGYIAATVLMLIVSVVNVYSIRWLIRVNSFLTLLKIIIPTVIGLLLIMVHFTSTNIFALKTYGYVPFGMHGILYSISLGGIIFAFNGFKQAAEMAGEARDPAFSVPFAIIGSIVLCGIIFLLLQFGFLYSLTPDNLSRGWDNIKLSGGVSPFAAQLYEHKISWALPVLYTGAIIAPLAASFMYMCSGARSLYGISSCGLLPSFLQKLNVHGNPGYAVIVNFLVGMLMFAPLPGWDKMAAFLTSLIAMTYAIAPVNMITLRYQLKNVRRPFKLPAAHLWAACSFYVCNLLVYWSGWDTNSKLCIALGAGIVVLSVDIFIKNKLKRYAMHFDFYTSIWVWPYFIGLSIISYLGSFGGGRGIIPFGWDFAVIAVFSTIILLLAIKFRLSSGEAYFYINKNIPGFAQGKEETSN